MALTYFFIGFGKCQLLGAKQSINENYLLAKIEPIMLCSKIH